MTSVPDTGAPGSDQVVAPDSRERTFTWSDPAALATIAASMSGAEFFTAITAGEIPPPPLMQALDFDGVAFGDGTAAFSLTPREFHYNPIGTVHGGVFATMLDSACGCAVHTKLPRGVFYTSLDLSVKFLRPVTVATGPIKAEGTVVYLGRRTALAEARITDEAGKLYVTATSSCLILGPDQA